jgi:hypothetical protein
VSEGRRPQRTLQSGKRRCRAPCLSARTVFETGPVLHRFSFQVGLMAMDHSPGGDRRSRSPHPIGCVLVSNETRCLTDSITQVVATRRAPALSISIESAGAATSPTRLTIRVLVGGGTRARSLRAGASYTSFAHAHPRPHATSSEVGAAAGPASRGGPLRPGGEAAVEQRREAQSEVGPHVREGVGGTLPPP